MGRLSVMKYKTKRRTRDLDLIYGDLGSKESIHKLKNQPLDETKPGLGQFYCIPCAKYFENDAALKSHEGAKVHKRRLRLLSLGPYTQLEADAAAGVGVQNFLAKVEEYKARAKREAEEREQNKLEEQQSQMEVEMEPALVEQPGLAIEAEIDTVATEVVMA